MLVTSWSQILQHLQRSCAIHSLFSLFSPFIRGLVCLSRLSFGQRAIIRLNGMVIKGVWGYQLPKPTVTLSCFGVANIGAILEFIQCGSFTRRMILWVFQQKINIKEKRSNATTIETSNAWCSALQILKLPFTSKKTLNKEHFKATGAQKGRTTLMQVWFRISQINK